MEASGFAIGRSLGEFYKGLLSSGIGEPTAYSLTVEYIHGLTAQKNGDTDASD